jgi:hypothetical protein
MRFEAWLLGVALGSTALAIGCSSGVGGPGAGSSQGGAGSVGSAGEGASGTGASTASSGTGASTASSGTSASSSTGTGDPPGSCRSPLDCDPEGGSSNAVCATETSMCGGCQWQSSVCLDDSECDPDDYCTICDTCLPRCTSPGGDCVDGTTCGPDGLCIPSPCAADVDCPADFTCSQGACARKACSQDDDCSGYCVTGQCMKTLGSCLDCI